MSYKEGLPCSGKNKKYTYLLVYCFYLTDSKSPYISPSSIHTLLYIYNANLFLP